MSRRTDVTVGVTIVLAVVAVVVGTIYLKGTGFGREERIVQAQFREVAQLASGALVKYRGVPIGRVSEVALTPSGEYVMVSMTVADQVPLPEDPVVILSPESMFGDWQAEITSRDRFPRYRYTQPGDPTVLPGATLPDISQLTAVADRIAENLAVLSDRVETAFTEEAANRIRESIENIQQVSEELVGLLSRQEQALDELAGNLETTTETLGEAARAVNRIAQQVESAVGEGEVAAIVENIRSATAQMDTLATELQMVAEGFGGTMASADTSFQALSTLTQRVLEGEGTLGLLMRDTTLYARLVESNTVLQALLADIQANPRKYINLEIF